MTAGWLSSRLRLSLMVGEPGTDEIPDYYMTQVQHYLAVTGVKTADVAVLIGGNDFRIYTIEADEELQSFVDRA